MKNRMNRCCCPTEPIRFSCAICFFNCDYESRADLFRNLYVVKQRHPDGNEGHFGKITGTFSFNSNLIGEQATFFFDFNPDDGPEGASSFVRITLNSNIQLKIEIGTKSSWNTSTVTDTFYSVEFGGASSGHNICIHYDLGIVTVVITNGLKTTVVSSTYIYGNHNGGSVGFVANNNAFISTFSRAFSESDTLHEIFCPPCSGITCDPCCPEPAASSWVVTFSGITDGDPVNGYTHCVGLNKTHLLDPVGSGCQWRYYGDFADDMILACSRAASYIVDLQLINSGSGYCSLRLTLSLNFFQDPANPVNCGPLVIGQWDKRVPYQEGCSGVHTLVLGQLNADPFRYCDSVPPSVIVRSL